MRRIAGFGGEQLTPDTPGYDEARKVHNSAVDRRPAVIARCAGIEDVVRAIEHAQREGAELAVRAGGHSVAGMSLCDDGVVVDVRALNGVEVDPAARTVRAGAGATWGEFDGATQEHGLATTGGRVSTTGIAGLTLGGGSGWLERSYGLTCDSLIGAQMVTGEGDVVRASADENPDLLWALRGGGGNFGVVTELEYRLHEVGPLVYGGLAAWDPADARAVATAFRDFATGAPEACGLAMGYITAPPEDFVPPAWHNRRIFGLVGMWNGALDEGEAALADLLATRAPLVNLFGPIPYVALQSMIDDPPGLRNWWTADYLGDLPDEAVDAFCTYSEHMPPGISQALLVPWGAGVARAGADVTPLATRDAAWVVHPFATWEDPVRDHEHIAWARTSHAIFAPWATGGTYLNFVGDEGQDRVRAAFGDTYELLVDVKTGWDPGNVFHGNQNIRPRGGVEAPVG